MRLTRRVEVGLLALLGIDLLLLALGWAPAGLGAVGVGLVLLLGAVIAVERRVIDRAVARTAASEASVTRMLRGLSRSTSVDATIDAIVDDLREASGADHVVVARLRPAERIVEATLVSSSAGVPLSVTRFPASDLEPGDALSVRAAGRDPRGAADRGAASRGTTDRGDPAGGGSASATWVPGSVFARVDAGAGAAAVGRSRGVEEPDGPAGSGEPDGAGGAGGPDGQLGPGGSVGPGEGAGALRPGSTMYAVERIADRVSRAYGLRHVLAEPLVAGGHVVGALVLSRRTDAEWPAESRELLRSAAQDLSAALERAYAHEEARVRAATDALTGIPNRAYFEDLVELLGRGGRRANDALGILMLDLDHFKAVNDRYGHPAGDEVLRAMGRVLRMTVRVDDVPARYGGEEFVVVLRRATPETAVEIAERLRHAVRVLDTGAMGIGVPVTVSIGVAVGTSSARSLLERADAALYRAKRLGRDRVEVG